MAAVSAKIRSLTPEDRVCGVLPMSHVVWTFGGALGHAVERGDPLFAASFRSGSRARGLGAGPDDDHAGRTRHVCSIGRIRKL